MAVRKDGSIRKRCNECQYCYNQEFIAICPGCGDTFHSKLRDGRTFSKCYKCYRSTVSKCIRCDNNAYNGYALCRDCHQSTKPFMAFVKRDYEFEDSDMEEVTRVKFTLPDIATPLNRCETTNCTNRTVGKFCQQCCDEYRFAIL